MLLSKQTKINKNGKFLVLTLRQRWDFTQALYRSANSRHFMQLCTSAGVLLSRLKIKTEPLTWGYNSQPPVAQLHTYVDTKAVEAWTVCIMFLDNTFCSMNTSEKDLAPSPYVASRQHISSFSVGTSKNSITRNQIEQINTTLEQNGPCCEMKWNEPNYCSPLWKLL